MDVGVRWLIACRVLKSTEGSAIALSNYEGKKPVVLFFYPRVRQAAAQEMCTHIAQALKRCICNPEGVHLMQAATPGCTKQACAFRDSYGKFKDVGAEVFGISSDNVQKNSEFAKVMPTDLPFQGFERARRCYLPRKMRPD